MRRRFATTPERGSCRRGGALGARGRARLRRDRDAERRPRAARRAALDAGLAVVVDKPLAPYGAKARGAGRARAREREAADGVPQPALGLGPAHAAQAAGRGRARGRPALRVALRALAARSREADAWRETPAPRKAGESCSTSGATRRPGAVAVRAGDARVRRDRQPPRAARRRRRVPGTPPRPGTYSHLWMSALAAAPGPRLRVLGTRAAYVVAEVDGQEDALRAGRRRTTRARGGSSRSRAGAGS